MPNDSWMPFQKLDCYVAAKELARLVQEAGIKHSVLRDQACRASVSCFLQLAEGLPNNGVGMRRKYFTESNNSLHETVAAIDLARTFGCTDSVSAARIQEISAAGDVILFDESGVAQSSGNVSYIRRAGEHGGTQLGPGVAMALSPDSRWALLASQDRHKLRLVPVSGGAVRELHRRGGRGERRPRDAEGHGDDLRTRNAGRVGIRTSRKSRLAIS